ncbi:MAG TPA: alpha/beta hydrolase [Thermoanaerobaculia bacterium]|nr:alpha/beta hydrolase [Thermoanaerobaculia bacterium]
MTAHPQVIAFLEAQAALAAAADPPIPPISEQTPEMARAGYEALRQFLGDGETVARVEDRGIPGPAGDLTIRVYTPEGEGPFGALVYYHGGGWVIGSLDTHDHLCRALCHGAGCLVVSVGYRLAPEHRFPAAVEDAWAALGWVAEHVAGLGGDPTRLAVGGDSAGGNLAAVVSLRARDEGSPALALQLLIYPAVDMRMGHPSIEENAEGWVLTRDHMIWFRDHYLGGVAGRDLTDPRLSPLLAGSHAGVAPAWIATAELDPLRDEGEAYAAVLRAAGVPVEVTRYDGMVHVFFQLHPLLDDGRRAVAEACAALRRALSRAAADGLHP